FGTRSAAGAVLVSLAFVADGCGGSSAPSVAGLPATGAPATTSTGATSPTRFSACMRAHGLPSFPDPDSSGRVEIPAGAGIDKNSAVFRTAAQACGSLAPAGATSPQQQAELQRQLLAFASCMRSHGVPAFPDPQVVGGRVRLGVTAGQI